MQTKHIIRLCFLGIFFIVLVNIILYRHLMVEKIILNKNSYTSSVVLNLYQNCMNGIFEDKYGEVIPKLDPTNEFFKNYTAKCFKNSPILQADIFTESGQKVFSVGNFSIVPPDQKNKSPFYRMLHFVNSELFKEYIDSEQLILGAYVNYNGQQNLYKSLLVGDYFLDLAGNKLRVHLYRDFTELLSIFYSIEIVLFSSYVIFFVIFFIIIFYQTTKAQEVINKHSEVILMLSQAKKKAEFESESTTKFLANISHELRTPLNAIIGFSEIIIANKNDPHQSDRYLDYINDIHNSGKDLLSLINDILDYSKAASNKLTIIAVPLKLNKIIHYCIRTVEPRARKNKIKLLKSLPEISPVINADSLRLRQVFLNLLSNAIKFTDSGGNVEVSVKYISNGKKVEISITDDGRGMAKEDIPRAMSTFQQLDNTKNRNYEGTGLGLPLTKKLIEILKGKLKIESELGKGTKATVTFKIAKIPEKKK